MAGSSAASGRSGERQPTAAATSASSSIAGSSTGAPATTSASGIAAAHTALSIVYTTMTGSATAAQRLLALDPGDVAAVTFALAPVCEDTAAEATLGPADLSDPLLDVLAQRHLDRDRPLFAS